MIKLLKNELDRKRAKVKPEPDEELIRLRRMLKREIKIKFHGSLKLYIIDTGSCSACELELQALFNPLYNVAEIGVEVVYNIKDADMLFVTGLLTTHMHREVERLYRDLKAPKHLIAIGECPLGTSVFKESFALENQREKFFEKSHTIAGCPPDPRTLIRGLLRYLEKI